MASANARSRKKRSGRNARGLRCSCQMKAARPAAETAKAPMISGADQPRSSPSTTAQMSGRVNTMPRTDPAPSNPRPVPFDSRSASATRAMVTTPMGTLSQKMPGQVKPSTTAPPMMGPAAMPSPLTPPHTPIAMGLTFGVVDAETSARESGTMPAAPRPCSARIAMSMSELVESAAPMDASVKSATPARNTRRRPIRSPSAATGSMNAVNTTLYELTNH